MGARDPVKAIQNLFTLSETIKDLAKAQVAPLCEKCGMTLASHPEMVMGKTVCPTADWVSSPSSAFHPPDAMAEPFEAFLVLCETMHTKKGKGYGQDYRNHRAVTKWGVPAWTSPARRIEEKVSRLASFVSGAPITKDQVLEELIDIAVLAGIAYILFGEQK